MDNNKEDPLRLSLSVGSSGRRVRRRMNSPPPPAIIPPPFPWSGNLRAKVRSMQYLRSQRISGISGEVKCKRCNETYEMEFDLEQKFKEVAISIAENERNAYDRAPENWLKPGLPDCRLCGQKNSARPVISEDDDSINWLFLYLGQMLGCCTLNHLKYFLKHANKHRTGAKDRLVYSTYMVLNEQLQSKEP